MRLWSIISVGIYLCTLYPSTAAFGVNGGINCAACTFFMALVEQLMQVRNYSVVETLDKICKYLPGQFDSDCRHAIDFFEPLIVQLVLSRNGPDVACHALRFCHTEPGQPVCKTMTPPFESQLLPFEKKVERARQLVNDRLLEFPPQLFICEIPGVKSICERIEGSLKNREPLQDLDRDGFSPILSSRGSAWRGKDCSDLYSNVHPGAIPIEGDAYLDSNCNGIYGINNVTKQTYEDELCSRSEPRGVMALGDSISAHFSLPPNWLDATTISKDAFKHLKMILQNEIDWPMLSSITGHGNNTWTEVIRGPMDSIYKRMVERNRCNHRDYQNIAENGEQSFSIHQLMKTMSRNPTKDRPLLVIFALVGNDICRGAQLTLDNMTTPKEMYDNTLKTLNYLNQHLPVGSHVIIVSLVDGRILYELMHNRIHPVGRFWQNFTYSKFYDYLTCLQISPCPGWLNTDKVVRDKAAKSGRTSQFLAKADGVPTRATRREQLNMVLKNVVKKNNGKFSNFKVNYMNNPVKRVIKKWAEKGGSGWQLIQPSDGFHNNQVGQALASEEAWQMILEQVPEALGSVNPHNAKILRLFGDQSGL